MSDVLAFGQNEVQISRALSCPFLCQGFQDQQNAIKEDINQSIKDTNQQHE